MKNVIKQNFRLLFCALAFSGLKAWADLPLPPSKFMGIGEHAIHIEGTNRLVHGPVPYEGKPYTGYWSDATDSHRTTITEGTYKDGIPVGVWTRRTDNGLLDTMVSYTDDARFREISYFPDGSIRWVINGHLDLVNVKKITDSWKSFEAEWYGLPEKEVNIYSDSMGHNFFYTQLQILFNSEWKIAADNSFLLWIYISPASRKAAVGVGKVVVTGKYNAKENKFEDVSQKTWGKYGVRLSAENGSLIAEILCDGEPVDGMEKISVKRLDAADADKVLKAKAKE